MRPLPALALASPALLLASAALAQQCDGWVPIGDPSPRSGHAMAFDSARGVHILFGGQPNEANYFNGQPTSETWEYDGRRWRFRTLDGPTPRRGAAIAYDAARQVTVLFGGTQHVGGSYLMLGDTWEWNGSAWTQRSIPAPAPRERAAMAFDPIRNHIVLYGGTVTSNTETWIYNGSQWTLVQGLTTTPGAQSDHSMVWDPTRSAILLHTYDSQTWAWNGSEWAALAGGTGAATKIAYDPGREAVIGLETGVLLGRTFQLTTGNEWIVLPIPLVPARGARLAYNHATLNPFTVGAQPNLPPDQPTVTGFDLIENVWQPRLSNTPACAAYPALAFDTARAVTVLAGGMLTSGSNPLPHTWELRGETWTRRADTPFTPNTTTALGYDQQSGLSVATQAAGTWLWDGQQWTSAGPGVPATHSTYDPQLGLVFTNHATYTYSNGAITPHTTAVVDPNMPIAFDPGRATIVAVGGNSYSGTRLLEYATPSFYHFLPRQTGSWAPSAAYDPTRGGVICFGGFSSPSGSSFPRSTFFLSSTGEGWIDTGLRGPSGRKFAGMVYDSVAERIVYFGGDDHSTAMRQTWRLSNGPTAIARQPLDISTAAGELAELFIIARGGGALDYRWRRDGVPLEDDARVSGAYSDTLIIDPADPEDAGQYDCIVSGPCGTVISTAATLTIASSCYANCDSSTTPPTLNIADFSCFLTKFAAGDPYANCDQSTTAPTLNIADFSCFLTRFAAGCP